MWLPEKRPISEIEFLLRQDPTTENREIVLFACLTQPASYAADLQSESAREKEASLLRHFDCVHRHFELDHHTVRASLSEARDV